MTVETVAEHAPTYGFRINLDTDSGDYFIIQESAWSEDAVIQLSRDELEHLAHAIQSILEGGA